MLCGIICAMISVDGCHCITQTSQMYEKEKITEHITQIRVQSTERAWTYALFAITIEENSFKHNKCISLIVPLVELVFYTISVYFLVRQGHEDKVYSGRGVPQIRDMKKMRIVVQYENRNIMFHLGNMVYIVK